MELKFGNQRNYKDNQLFVREDHFKPYKPQPHVPVPQMVAPEVLAQLSVEGAFEPAEGGRFLSVEKLVEVAKTPEGLFSVLNIVQNEAGNVAGEMMLANSLYNAKEHGNLGEQIANYNKMLRAIKTLLERLQDRLATPTPQIANLIRGINRSLASIDTQAAQLIAKVESATGS